MKENHFRKGEPATKDEPNANRPGAVPPEPDLPHQGLNILAFLLPPLGLGLFLYNRQKSPRRAASVARWSWAVLAPGDHDHILSGVFNQFLSANPRASRINKKSANNPALID